MAAISTYDFGGQGRPHMSAGKGLLSCGSFVSAGAAQIPQVSLLNAGKARLTDSRHSADRLPF